MRKPPPLRFPGPALRPANWVGGQTKRGPSTRRRPSPARSRALLAKERRPTQAYSDPMSTEDSEQLARRVTEQWREMRRHLPRDEIPRTAEGQPQPLDFTIVANGVAVVRRLDRDARGAPAKAVHASYVLAPAVQPYVAGTLRYTREGGRGRITRFVNGKQVERIDDVPRPNGRRRTRRRRAGAAGFSGVGRETPRVQIQERRRCPAPCCGLVFLSCAATRLRAVAGVSIGSMMRTPRWSWTSAARSGGSCQRGRGRRSRDRDGGGDLAV